MLKPPQHLDLVVESRASVLAVDRGSKELEGHRPARSIPDPFVDLSHPTCTDQSNDPVGTDLPTDEVGGSRSCGRGGRSAGGTPRTPSDRDSLGEFGRRPVRILGRRSLILERFRLRLLDAIEEILELPSVLAREAG